MSDVSSAGTAAPRGLSNAVKAVSLLWLLGLLTGQPSLAIDVDCNYQQYLEAGKVYYAYNPDYPQYTVSQRNCRWSATSQHRVRLSCLTVDIPCSRNCQSSSLRVTIGDGIQQTYCQSNWFVTESQGNRLILDYLSQNGASGKFLCKLQAITEADDRCECGWRNPSRIVGGTEVGVNEYPMMAGMVDASLRELYCGATIISNEYVVTAAHCVDGRSIQNLGVIVGEHNVNTGSDTNATVLFQVREIIQHPDYRDGNSSNDIALVRVQGIIPFSNEVGPVCLPFYHARDTFAGSELTALGWGLTEFGGSKSDVLMKVELNGLSNPSCQKAYGNKEVTDNELCTYKTNKDTCQFDSGGPLLWEDKANRQLILCAITSQGRGCAGPDPGLNVRIGPHMGWILEKCADVKFCMKE